MLAVLKMNSLRIRYSETKGDGILSDEEYEFFLNEEGIRKKLVIDSLISRHIFCNFAPVLPENWRSMPVDERHKFVESNLFDVGLKAVYFKKVEATKNDIEILCQFPNIQRLWIQSDALDITDLKKLKTLKLLSDFILIAMQFSDDLIEVISEFKNLRLLDVQSTSLSKTGSDNLKKILPKGCQVWFPYNIS